MKGEELRYGNYVYGHFSNGKKTVVQHFDFSSDVDGYEPIPLTEDWLKRFGCRGTPTNKKLFDCGILSLYLEYDGDVTVRRIYGVNSCYLTSIMYVHQLQNLYYAITGEELILKK